MDKFIEHLNKAANVFNVNYSTYLAFFVYARKPCAVCHKVFDT